MPLILSGNVASATGGGYEVANSCRINRADSARMTLSMSSGGSETKFTKSCWVKRCAVEQQGYIFDNSGVTEVFFKLDSGGGCSLGIYESSPSPAYTTELISTQLFRDPSAWYHFVVAVDYTNATQAHRARIYVNNQEITSWSTETRPSNNTTTFNTWNSSKTHYIGSTADDTHYFNGYLAEVVHIDGLALTPSSFGEYDSDSPTIWKPIDVSGLTFGTKGYYLDFEDSDNLGDDESGNTADWTEVNLDATDQATDTPTNNFATLNGLHQVDDWSLAQGNLEFTNISTGSRMINSNIAASQGKWYAEVKVDTLGGNYPTIGVINPDVFLYNTYLGNSGRGYGYLSSGSTRFNDSTTSFDNTYTTGDIIGVAMDLDNYKLYFSKNGTFQDSGDPTSGATGTGSAYNLATSVSYSFAQSSYDGGTDPVYSWNFGNPPYAITSGNADANGYGNFEYAVPSGYYALCTKNLAEYG